MRKTAATKIAGAVTLVALGALTMFALRPSERVAPLAPPVQTRTQVIHRTVWIVRHEKPALPHRSRSVAAAAPPRPGQGGGSLLANVAAGSAPRTSTSKAHSTSLAATATNAAAPSTSGSSAGQAVTTHTSRGTAKGSTPSSGTPTTALPNSKTTTGKPVTTTASGSKKTGSGSGTANGAAKPSGSTTPVTTKTSGSAGSTGDDGGHDD